MAIEFDLERLEVRGQPVTFVEGVMHSIFTGWQGTNTGAAQVAFSASGHLAYALGGVFPEGPGQTAIRVTSNGDTLALDLEIRQYETLRVSPDGNRLAFTSNLRGGDQIWVHDLTRGTTQPLNTGGFDNGPIEWSPEGRFLAFSSDRDGDVKNVNRIASDGSGEPERLPPSDQVQHVASWSSEGVIAFLEGDDIWILPPDGRPAPFVTTEWVEWDATFSSDGRWLAYRSYRSGTPEVYVRPYPGPEPATLISIDGGLTPAWSPDDRQIFYVGTSMGAHQGVLMAVDVIPGDAFQAGRPIPLIDRWGVRSPVRGYDVFPDGSFVRSVGGDTTGLSSLERLGATELHIVLNWTEELKERLPN